jgi:HEPN domain-containing protein
LINKDQYWEIDKFYSKADSILREAREHAKKLEYDLCVRRSQEAFELFLKTMFKFIERVYPQKHDVSEEIYAVFDALKKHDISAQKVAQIVHRNRTLGLWREKAFYGDEKLGVTSIFTEHETQVALAYAEAIMIDCSMTKSRIWMEIVEKSG